MFTPNKTRILVSKTVDHESKVGGIVIPGSVSVGAHVFKATVVEVGPDVNAFSPGDVVVLPVAGYELTIEGLGYRVVEEADILGKFSE